MTAHQPLMDPSSAILGAGAAVLAFDIGGTTVKAALFDSAGRVVELSRSPTPHTVRDGRAHCFRGHARELGHSIIDLFGERSACGARGWLETIASAAAIACRYQRAANHRASAGGARFVLARAGEEDPIAQRIWTEALDALALAIAQLTAIFTPDTIVIGGGLAQAGDTLFLPLRERVEALLSYHRRPAIRPATLGENAGIMGAALQARSMLNPPPERTQ